MLEQCSADALSGKDSGSSVSTVIILRASQFCICSAGILPASETFAQCTRYTNALRQLINLQMWDAPDNFFYLEKQANNLSQKLLKFTKP
jgi:hypothetical protein